MAAMPAQPSVDESVEPAAPPRGQGLWGVLLVLDAVFMVTFGGTLGMKVYQHVFATPEMTAPKRPHRPPKTPPAPKPAEPAAAKPEPPKPAEPAKPAPKQAETPAEAGLRPPKPSLLSEAPAREKAGLQGAAASSAAAADASKQKAVPTDFSIKAPGAKSVELAGAFLVRGGGKKAMVGHPDGTWTVTLYLTPNTYRYWFLVNGKKTLDPLSPTVDRGASVRTVAP
jgi:outer membrane biosynthesis protein TonB